MLDIVLSLSFIALVVYLLYRVEDTARARPAWGSMRVYPSFRCSECKSPVTAHQDECEVCKTKFSNEYECPACGKQVKLSDEECRCGAHFVRSSDVIANAHSKMHHDGLIDALKDESPKEPDGHWLPRQNAGAHCPECGREVAKGDKSCKACGAKFWSAVAPPEKIDM